MLLNAQDTSAYILLKKYYAIKEALVEGDSKLAASAAAQFGTSISQLNKKQVDEATSKKLAMEVKAISDNKDLEKQRDAFSPFSEEMFQLVKKTSLSSAPVYRQYCPMKKMYWLSDKTIIRNPYYGSMMLSCGKVVETIQPK
jgi:hypothetical protein